MFSTGLVRKIDLLGRLTLPSEIRKRFFMNPNDPVEFFVSDDLIILRKYSPADIFNGEMRDLIEYHGKKVSKSSIREMAELAGYELRR